MTTPPIEVDQTTIEAFKKMASDIHVSVTIAIHQAKINGIPNSAIRQLLYRATIPEVMRMSESSRYADLQEYVQLVATNVIAERRRDAMIALEVPEMATSI